MSTRSLRIYNASATIGRATRHYSVKQRSKKLLTLSERLLRLNLDMKAESGEDGFDRKYETDRVLTTKGFAKLMENANCNKIHLSNFNPISNGIFVFKGTQFESAILTNFGAGLKRKRLDWSYQGDPYHDMSRREFRFELCNMSGATIDNAGNVLSEFRFEDSILKGTNLAGMISKLHVIRCDAEGSNFSGSSFWGETLFERSNLKDSNFTNMLEIKTKMFVINIMSAPQITHTINFNDCNLDGADFSDTKCGKLEFLNCSFVGTKFKDADLTQAVFDHCDLLGVDFGNAILTHTKFVKCKNVASANPTDWSDDFYDHICVNALKEPGISKIKIDPISMDDLKRGKEMVAIRKFNTDKEYADCFNREGLETWFHVNSRNTNPLTNEKIDMKKFNEDNNPAGGIVTGGLHLKKRIRKKKNTKQQTKKSLRR